MRNPTLNWLRLDKPSQAYGVRKEEGVYLGIPPLRATRSNQLGSVMSLSVNFSAGRRFQQFTVAHQPGGLIFTRVSNKSLREYWFALSTSAYVTEVRSYRAATENIGFSMGNTYQRFDKVTDNDLWVDDSFYDYEADQDRMAAADHEVWRERNVQSFTPPF